MSRGANAVRPIASTLLALGFALNNPSAFAGEARTPVRSLLEIREDRVIVQKWETSCAAAALATVLTFSHNDPVTEKAVTMGMLRTTDPIKVKVRGGFSMLDMKHFVETRGFNGIGYKNLVSMICSLWTLRSCRSISRATRTLSWCVASMAMAKFTSLIPRSETTLFRRRSLSPSGRTGSRLW